MRPASLAALLLALACPTAFAATPEADYIAARNAAVAKIARLEAKNPSADIDKPNRQALAELEGRLKAVVGGLSVRPYPETGKIAFDSLSRNDVGSGGLDALRFATADGEQQAYVTTDGLLTRWLNQPEEWWRKTSKTPPSIEGALANPEFYTYAIGVDAALTETAGLKIEKPAGAEFVHALLGGWAQDIGPNPDQEIIVALRRGGKVYLAQEKARAFKPIPACEAIWTEGQRKAEEIDKKYSDGGEKDRKLVAAHEAVQSKADADYHACYAERTPKADFFPALVKEAQAIADRFKGE